MAASGAGLVLASGGALFLLAGLFAGLGGDLASFAVLLAPTIGLAAVFLLSLVALFGSKWALRAAVGCAFAVGIVLWIVPLSLTPFEKGASQLNFLPAGYETVNFPLKIVEETRISTGNAGPMDLAWSPDGSRLSALLTNNDVVVWDAHGRQLSRFNAEIGPSAFVWPQTPAFLHGTSQLLLPYTLSDQPNAPVLEVFDASGRPVRSIPGPPCGASRVIRIQGYAVSSDQRWAAVGFDCQDDIDMAILSTDSWTYLPVRLVPKEAHPSDGIGVGGLSLFARDRRLAITGYFGQLYELDPLSSATPKVINVFTDGPFVMAGSPDGTQIFGGGANAALAVRESDGALITAFPKVIPEGGVREAAWDPKGRYVAFVTDQHLTLWRPSAAGYADVTLDVMPGEGWSTLAISPDGNHLVAATGHGAIMFSIH